MKIAVDINHPANVHYFKNFIKEMEQRGHDVLITASNKEISFRLLDLYGFKYKIIGSYGHSIIEKLFKIIWLDIKMFFAVRKFNPDLFLGFASVRASHIGRFLRKKTIILTDTEHASLGIKLFKPFCDTIVTPQCYWGDFGSKHIKFKSYMELMYLHPNRFKPDSKVLEEAGLRSEEKFVLIRFVSWEAHHDIGISNTSKSQKLALVKEIEKYARVLISSEKELPAVFSKYKISLSPDKIHHLMFYATLYIGEGGTMASEAAALGTHALYCNPLFMGYLAEEQNYGLLFHFDKLSEHNCRSVAEKAVELLSDDSLLADGKLKREKLLKDNVDATKWLIDYIEKELKDI